LSSLQNRDFQTTRSNGVVQVTGAPARDIDVTMLASVRRDSFSNKSSSSRSNSIISTPSPLTCSNGDRFLEDSQVTRLNSPVRDDERSRSDDKSSELENHRPQLYPDDNCNDGDYSTVPDSYPNNHSRRISSDDVGLNQRGCNDGQPSHNQRSSNSEVQEDVPLPTLQPSFTLSPESKGVNPDALMKCFKSLKSEVLQPLGLREFYKSYSTWEKMSIDQRNKALSWFRRLPEQWQGVC
jgi:hypothetical protein